MLLSLTPVSPVTVSLLLPFHRHTYNPCVAPADIKIDADRAKEWIKSGAQPTDTVRALLKKVDVL